MHSRLIPSLTSAAILALSSTSQAAPAMLVDFAGVQGSSAGNWNNLNSGTSLTNLIDTSGAATTIDLTLTFGGGTGFGGGAFNNNDSGAPAPFNLLNAYSDGLYSNDHTTSGIDLAFSDLAPNTSYAITLYGGRNDGNWSNANVTITTGSGTGGTVTHRSATTFNVSSDASGNITLNFVDNGSNASSGANATLTALSIGGPSNPLPTIEAFTVNDHYVTPGTAVTFSWETTNATTISIDQGIGDVTTLSTDGDGNTSANVATTTSYTLTATGAAGTATKTLRVGAGAPKPNILFFLVDDMGWQDTSVPFHYNSSGTPILGTYNTRYRTPNMETLAAQGRKFTNAYAYSICSPTRVSIMTGMHAARHHVTTWTHPQTPQHTGGNSIAHLDSPPNWRKGGMDATDIALPKLLQDAGYRTIHAGKAHFGPNSEPSGDPTFIGFDINIAGHGAGGPGSFLGSQNFSGVWRGAPAYWDVPGLDQYHIANYGQEIFLTEAITLEMNKAIEQAVSDGTPFFAYMSHYAVHVPWTTDHRFSANYDGNPASEPKLSGQELQFATIIEGMDKSLGDIMTKLDQLGVAENTIVIFYSDNGSDLRDGSELSVLRGHKGTQWEGAYRVPFIVGWAKLDGTNSFQQALPIPANTRDDAIINCEDMFPTVAAIAGASYNHRIDGYDLRKYFKGTPGTHRPQQFIQHFPHGHGSDHFAVLRQGDWKIIHHYGNGSTMLYNLATDIGETNNLANAEPERLMAMTRHLRQQLEGMDAQYSVNKNTNQPVPPALPNLPDVDVDNDGIPDLTEDSNGNGLVDPGETDPDNPDTDGNGISDGDEVKLGLDPLDQSSYFYLTPARLAGGSVQITWPSAPGATFTIRSSTDLADWSNIVANGVSASSGTSTSHNLGKPVDPCVFYRVELE